MRPEQGSYSFARGLAPVNNTPAMKLAITECKALAASATVWRLAGTWAPLPFLAPPGVAVALTWIDLTQRRSQHRVVLPALGASMPVLLLACGWDRRVTAFAGAACLFAYYLLLALVNPRGMRMGDVKVAALVGLYAGYPSGGWRCSCRPSRASSWAGRQPLSRCAARRPSRSVRGCSPISGSPR